MPDSRANPAGWPKTGEDKLLDAYWRSGAPGTLYTEVGIGSDAKLWPGASERRIDGVIARDGAPNERRHRSSFQTDIESERPWAAVDLIEVKMGLSERVIGQALAAQTLFAAQFGERRGVEIGRDIVLYKHEDVAMKWAAEKLGLLAIRQEVPEPNNPMRARPHYHLRGDDIARLVADRVGEPGQIVTRIPIGGEDSGVTAWTTAGASAAQTFVKYVRVVGSQTSAVTAFESPDSFLGLVEGRELELLVVQRKLTRGAIGVAKVHAMMLTEQYAGIPTPSLAVVCNRSDAALEAACADHGIAVRVVTSASQKEDEDGED